MPPLSVFILRIGLVYLGAGFSLGMLLLANKGLGFAPLLWRWIPLHIELLLGGWTAHLIVGVAFWILPRFMHPPKRGNERVVWAALLLLNLGLWLAALSPLFSSAAGVLIGRLAQAAAALLFAAYAWRRVKPSGT